MKRLFALCLALVCVGFMASALVAAPANPGMSSANYSLNWSAVGEISGGASASANYKLNATIGQMAATTASASANYAECSGFQCVVSLLRTYLPVIVR
jgi:hypothetical protein